MADDLERAPADRHATWVALRTLRQRPVVVGRTESGETVYEVGSVQAVLAGGAHHFSRLVQCAKCRRDVAGPPLLSPSYLDRPPNPVFCDGCVRAAPSIAIAAPPAPPPPPAPAPRPASATPSTAPDDGAPMAAIEAWLTDVTRRLNSPHAADPQVGALAEAVAELRRELREVAGAPAETASGVSAMLDTQRAEFEASLEGAQRELRAELSALAQQLRDELATISALIAAQRGEMKQALADAVQRTRVAMAPPIEELNGRQQALEDRVSEELAAVRRESLAERAPLAEGLRQLRNEVASLAESVDQARVQALRDALQAVSDSLGDLTRSRQETEHRLDTLTASIDAGASRHHLLEQRLNEYIEQITRMFAATADADPDARRRSTAGILEALEVQLRAAEERIAQR